MSDLLSEQEVSVQRLEKLFATAFLRTEIDKDGDLVIRDEGINTFVKVDSDRKMITFFSIWGLKERRPETEKLKFANQMNDDLIMVRFSVPRPNILWCDYQFLYEGGITAFQILRTYKRFVSVCKGAAQRDSGRLIG